MVIIIACATFVSTLIGGLFALRFKDKLHLILGFSAGAVLGVAFFDLMPESISLGQNFYSAGTIASLIAVGFIVYLILDRLIFLHAHSHDQASGQSFDEHEDSHNGSEHTERGILGAASLSVHSLLDGVAIGLAFQVSAAIGAVVTIAVLAHDFSDGINTVNLILKNHGGVKKAFHWLIVDALAPVLGALSTLFFSLPEKYLGVILAIFCGFFLYIGASDLVPESHHTHPKLLTTLMTILGAGVLYVVIRAIS